MPVTNYRICPALLAPRQTHFIYGQVRNLKRPPEPARLLVERLRRPDPGANSVGGVQNGMRGGARSDPRCRNVVAGARWDRSVSQQAHDQEQTGRVRFQWNTITCRRLRQSHVGSADFLLAAQAPGGLLSSSP